MEKELLNILEKSKSNEELIENTVELVKKEKDLDDSIRCCFVDKEIGDKTHNSTLDYNLKNKNIYIYLPKIEQEFLKLKSTFEMFEISDLEMGAKIQIMHYILHELEHANQEKIFYSSRKDDEAIMIKTSLSTIIDTFERDNIIEKNLDFDDLVFSTIKSYFECMESSKRNLEFYKKNYNIIPFERMADIQSFKTISNVLDLAESKQVLYYYKARLEFAKLRGYKEAKYPLFHYLDIANKIDVLSELSFYDENLFQMLSNIEQLSLDEKLYLGLHVSDEEKEYTESKVKKYLSRI